jgi:hypothetical protein
MSSCSAASAAATSGQLVGDGVVKTGLVGAAVGVLVGVKVGALVGAVGANDGALVG